MSFLPLKDLLPRAIRSAGIADQVQAARVLEVCQSVLNEMLPLSLCGSVTPLYLRHSVLTVQVPSSAVAQELRLREKEILYRLNKKFPKMVERLNFRFTSHYQ